MAMKHRMSLAHRSSSFGLTLLLLPAAFVPVRADEMDAVILEQMRARRIPGLSLAVIKEGKVVKTDGFGQANVETGTPATPETVFKIASLSKPVIATAIMLLVQEGRMALDDQARTYLVESPESWNGITIRHLLSHTSGIVRDPADYEPYREQPVTDVLESVYPLPLAFPPGETWLYSNVGYYALAEIISRVSGSSWDEFIVDRLFAPAGMTATRTVTTAAIVPHRASGYTETSDGMINAPDWIAVRPSGAFLSSVVDLARWDALLGSDGPLSPASRRQMWTPVSLNDGTPTRYGLGWYVESFLGRRRVHHDGQFPGFRSDYERFEDDRLTVIALANSDRTSLESIAVTVAGHYSPALTAPEFVLKVTAAAKAAEVGKPVTIAVTAKDGGKAAPDTVLEMEIWDAWINPVFKQHQAHEDFAAGETKTYTFSWTPTEAGTFTVNLGAYGPRWLVSYGWAEKAATIKVE